MRTRRSEGERRRTGASAHSCRSAALLSSGRIIGVIKPDVAGGLLRCAVVAARQFGVLTDTYGLGCWWRTVMVTVLPGGSGSWPGAELKTGG